MLKAHQIWVKAFAIVVIGQVSLTNAGCGESRIGKCVSDSGFVESNCVSCIANSRSRAVSTGQQRGARGRASRIRPTTCKANAFITEQIKCWRGSVGAFENVPNESAPRSSAMMSKTLFAAAVCATARAMKTTASSVLLYLRADEKRKELVIVLP